MTRSLLNVDDYQRGAKARLPWGLFEFVAGGTEDQCGVEELRRAMETLRFVPPVLVDVSDRSLATELFGVKRGGPLIVAPTGSAGLMWHKGEIALAQACAAVDAPFCVSTDSITALEDIAAASTARLWMQIYRHHDRSIADQLIERAARVGAEAIVITVDMPVLPKREYNARSGLVPLQLRVRTVVDMALHARWVFNVLCRYLVDGGMPCFAHYPGEYRTPITRLRKPQARVADNVTWDEIASIRRRWPGKFILKGIVRPEDALLAAEHGADAIVVSNHGGRNLDFAVTAASALPRVVDAVGSRLTVLADGGVRRGSDVVKLLALGAKGVMVGRAPLYGVAVGGRAGAEHVLEILNDETLRTMAYLGKTRVAALSRADLDPLSVAALTGWASSVATAPPASADGRAQPPR